MFLVKAAVEGEWNSLRKWTLMSTFSNCHDSIVSQPLFVILKRKDGFKG